MQFASFCAFVNGVSAHLCPCCYFNCAEVFGDAVPTNEIAMLQ